MRLRRTTKHENEAIPQKRGNEYKGLTPIFIAACNPGIWVIPNVPREKPRNSLNGLAT
jgi:hypothetical protein